MNNISWFLYAVDFLDGFGKFSIGAALASCVIGATGFGVYLSLTDDINRAVNTNKEWKLKYNEDYKDSSDIENMEESRLFCMKALRGGVITAMIFIFFALIIPSSRTMYLILGSEVGETAITSETGQRVQDAINKKLDEYLKDN